MLIRPDPNPDDIELDGVRKFVENLQSEPLSKGAVADAAIALTYLDPTIVRYDRVRTQGRVSFGRRHAYTDGVAVYLAPSQVPGDDPKIWDNDAPHGDNKRVWGNVEWDDPKAVGEALAYVVWAVHAPDQEGDALSELDPAVQLLCHAAADRGDAVQIRRGVRAEGRVSFDARKGDKGVALFIPSWKMARPRHGTAPAEAHIESAYGRPPPSPASAQRRKGTHTADPERL